MKNLNRIQLIVILLSMWFGLAAITSAYTTGKEEMCTKRPSLKTYCKGE